MLETSQPWNLFGYDLRGGWYIFQAGWRDFLWGSNSPVLPMIDETVEVYRESTGPLYYQAGQSVPQSSTFTAPGPGAVLLPDKLVLCRVITVPRAAEGSLRSVLAIEVKANSPFPEDDTCYGWSILETTQTELSVQLAISSSSTVMEYIGRQLDCHDVHAYEVWALSNNQVVILSGFGEEARQTRNKKRMIRAGLGVSYCLAVVVACFAVAAGAKYLELQWVKESHRNIEQQAANAVKIRSDLSVGKLQLATIDAMIAESPDLMTELARLSHLLGDSTWLTAIDIKGTKIRIDGSSLDAAAVMQKLIDEPAYGDVTAPAAIRKEKRSGTERFVLDMSLASGNEG